MLTYAAPGHFIPITEIAVVCLLYYRNLDGQDLGTGFVHTSILPLTKD